MYYCKIIYSINDYMYTNNTYIIEWLIVQYYKILIIFCVAQCPDNEFNYHYHYMENNVQLPLILLQIL